MKVVDLYARVRRACHVEGMSQRQAARLFGIDPKTVAKMLRFSVPPGGTVNLIDCGRADARGSG
jgi:transcriptional regulator with XRE-family HTH domain